MLVRALPLLLLLGLPASGWCQNPLRPPQAAQGVEAEHEPADQLTRLSASRDALTAEIERLRKATGQQQQVVVSVQVCELSLTKARQAKLDLPGVDFNRLQAYSSHFADLFPAADDAQSGSRSALGPRVLKDDKLLKQVLAELNKGGAVNIIAEPTVTSLSGQPASFHSGGEFPILVTQGDGKTATQFRRYGTHVDVTPVVLGKGKIKLDLRPEVSELDESLNVTTGGVTVPGLRTRRIDTSLEMNAGETYLLSGLVTRGQSRTKPGETEEIELIVIVRAEIVDSL